jgi:hypothetical protein
MLAAGNTVPPAIVFTTPRETATVAELVSDGPILLLFYVFDWSST